MPQVQVNTDEGVGFIDFTALQINRLGQAMLESAKLVTAIVQPDETGNFELDISGEGFTAPPIVVPVPQMNFGDAPMTPELLGQTSNAHVHFVSPGRVRGYITRPNAVALNLLPMLSASLDTTPKPVALLMMGQTAMQG